jgi:exonuclease I
MEDDWEDWENENYSIPILNSEQLKRLEERKLVEESDNKIASQLFGHDEQEEYEEDEEEDLSLQNQTLNNDKILKPIRNKRNFVNKQKENEEKMKEKSKKIKEEKEKKQKEKELFGQAEEYDEYDKFTEKFY